MIARRAAWVVAGAFVSALVFTRVVLPRLFFAADAKATAIASPRASAIANEPTARPRDDDGAPSTRTAPSASSDAPYQSVSAAAPAGRPPIGARAADRSNNIGGAHVVTREEIERAMADKLGGATARMVNDDAGKPLGLELHGVGRLAKFGVHDGDVLLSANGYPLRTADEGMAALGAIDKTDDVTLTFLRKGRAYSVRVKIAR